MLRTRLHDSDNILSYKLGVVHSYAAGTWDRKCRVIVKAEHSRRGNNPRYVITNLPGNEQELYDNPYCARGDMDNRITEQQLYLFADGTSCHHW
ncbi:MAG: hypothetical protein CSA34_07365 [Desulfobulbus propionicus]|nr:MAG: hypothetical protein CSA34_07365 [Desulfobulbus propionicus]